MQALKGSLFVQTVLLVGVAIALAGGLLTYLLLLSVEGQVQREAVRDVEALRPRVLKLISPPDLVQPISGARYAEVDRRVRDYVVGPDVVRFKLWNASGTVVYSTLAAQIGESYTEDRRLQQALQGRAVWELTREPESPQERRLGELLEVYVPLTWEPGGKPVGAMEAYLPYEPYAGFLSSLRRAVLIAVLLASVTLPAALYMLYRAGTASVRRERDTALQRQREVAALNRLLQQDLGHYFDVRDRLSDLRAQMMQDPRFQADAETIPAREAWLLMQLREIGEFTANIKAATEQKPKGDAS